MDVVVVDANLPAVRPELEAALPPGCAVRWHPRSDPAAVAADLAGAEVLVASRWTASLLPACGALRLLQAPSAGVDGIDLAALPPRVAVARTGHHERSIAEHVLAGVVVLRRGLRELDAALREGRWASSTYDASRPQALALDGARTGFVGFGAIGAATWRAFAALGARGAAVTGSGRVDAAAAGLEWAAPALPARAGLHRLLEGSDVVVLSAPLTPESRGMVGARELALLPPGAVLVNVGRAGLVEEDALFDALASGRLGGAVLDVWWSYPRGGGATGAPSRRPFGELPNVLLSPHSSGVTRQTFLARAADVAGNVRRLVAGEPLVNPVPR